MIAQWGLDPLGNLLIHNHRLRTGRCPQAPGSGDEMAVPVSCFSVLLEENIIAEEAHLPQDQAASI